MGNNEQFESAIARNFKDVIIDLQFEVRYVRFDEIQFQNDKCILRFIFDTGRVLCDFINPEEKRASESNKRKDGMPNGFPVYPVHSIWKFLYPHDSKNFSYEGWDIDGQVLAIKKLLLERLTNVLNGDFSWTNNLTVF